LRKAAFPTVGDKLIQSCAKSEQQEGQGNAVICLTVFLKCFLITGKNSKTTLNINLSAGVIPSAL